MTRAFFIFFVLFSGQMLSQSSDTTFYHNLLINFEKDYAEKLRADSLRQIERDRARKKNNDTIGFERIFGCVKDYNGTILVTADNYSVKYSRESCNLKCTDNKGREKWTLDLNKLNCDVVFFSLIPKTKVKKCDAYFQLKDKRIFLLKSKNGKIKFMPAGELDKYGSKKNGRHVNKT